MITQFAYGIMGAIFLALALASIYKAVTPVRATDNTPMEAPQGEPLAAPDQPYRYTLEGWADDVGDDTPANGTLKIRTGKAGGNGDLVIEVPFERAGDDLIVKTVGPAFGTAMERWAREPMHAAVVFEVEGGEGEGFSSQRIVIIANNASLAEDEKLAAEIR